jgi:hypothetical protein
MNQKTSRFVLWYIPVVESSSWHLSFHFPLGNVMIPSKSLTLSRIYIYMASPSSSSNVCGYNPHNPKWIWGVGDLGISLYSKTQLNGHFRNRLIGGTYHNIQVLFFRPKFKEYPQKIKEHVGNRKHVQKTHWTRTRRYDYPTYDSVWCAEATNFIFNRNKHIITKISITFLHVQQLRCPNFSGSVSVSTKNLRTPNLASPKSQHQ